MKYGHQVTMITTSPSINQKMKIEFIDGVKVIYLRVPYDQSMGLLARLKSFLSFMIKSSLAALKEKSIDFTIATSTPLTVGFPALILKWVAKKPFIFEVRDLWPEVPIQMGALRNPFLIKMLRKLERIIYREATHIVALSPGMKDGILKYVEKKKVSMIPNMAKIEVFGNRDKKIKLHKQLKFKSDTFKVVHFGALGKANGAMSIIETAIILKNNPSIEFVFLGGGANEKDLKIKCIKHDLNNVKFLGNFPMNITAEIVNLCDVSIVSFLDLPILYTNSPNKFFDSLSAGKPIIVNSAGWTKELVEKYNCGKYVDPKNPSDLANVIQEFKNSPEKVKEFGMASRRLAEDKFDKSILCKEFVSVVHKVFGLPAQMEIIIKNLKKTNVNKNISIEE